MGRPSDFGGSCADELPRGAECALPADCPRLGVTAGVRGAGIRNARSEVMKRSTMIGTSFSTVGASDWPFCAAMAAA